MVNCAATHFIKCVFFINIPNIQSIVICKEITLKREALDAAEKLDV